MRYWTLLGILLTGFLAQTTVAGFLSIGGASPGILLALVASYGLLFGWDVGLVAGALAGLLMDAAFGRLVGLNVLTLGLAGLAVGALERRVFKDNLLLPLLAGFAATLATEGLTLLILLFFGQAASGAQIRQTLLAGALYNAIVTGLVYFRIYRSYHYLRPDPRGAILVVRRR